MSGWDYPDFRDGDPSEDCEFWEDGVPDHWWATDFFDDQYDRAKPDWDGRHGHG